MSLVSDIKELLEESGASTFWTPTQIYNCANTAQMMIWAKTKHDIVDEFLTVNANDDLVTLPSNIMIPTKVVLNNKEYFCTTQAKLEEHCRGWRAEPQAQPRWFVVWDMNTLRLWPRPDATYIFEIYGVQYPPTQIDSGHLDITAPTSLKQAVAHLAANLVIVMTRPDLAKAFEASSDEYLEMFRRQRRNRGGHRIDRLRPGTQLSGAHSGVIKLGRNYA